MRKKHKNPRGGLTAAGRAYFKRKEGSNLRPPVKSARRGTILEEELALQLDFLVCVVE